MNIEESDILSMFEDISNISFKDYDYDKLKCCLKGKLFGQDNNIDRIVDCLKLKNNKECSFLFCGSSGVGKSQCAKSISEELGYNFVKIDMSEYVLESSINKLIGVSDGYQGSDSEFILDSIRFNPRSVILVDEIEKGNRSIMNLFLNILDEGYIKDSKGEIIDFSQTIIIFTSNLKCSNSVGFFEKKKNSSYFSDEFSSRLDDIIVFNDIDERIIKEYLVSLNNEFLYEEVINNCDYKKYGFRAVLKYIDKNLKKTNKSA